MSLNCSLMMMSTFLNLIISNGREASSAMASFPRSMANADGAICSQKPCDGVYLPLDGVCVPPPSSGRGHGGRFAAEEIPIYQTQCFVYKWAHISPLGGVCDRFQDDVCVPKSFLVDSRVQSCTGWRRASLSADRSAGKHFISARALNCMPLPP